MSGPPRGDAAHQPPGDPALDPPRTETGISIELTTDPLSVDDAHVRVAHPACGGIGLFLGAVRDHHEGAAISGLAYEAWQDKAEDAMRTVAETILERHGGVRRVHVAHRLGPLDVGDVSVIVAASAPHRHEALEAARDLIDEVKRTVPIWKQEHLADGGRRWPGSDDVDR